MVITVFVWIIYKTLNHYSTEEILSYQYSIINESNVLLFIFGLLLMPINWYLESKKWSYSLTSQFKLKPLPAFKSILAGVTLGVFTPNRIGEFIGRVLTIPNEHRLQGVLANAVCSFAQLSTTLILGCAALICVTPTFIDSSIEFSQLLFQSLSGIVILFVLLIYFRSTSILKWVSRFKWLQKLLKNPFFTSKIESDILLPILSMSVIRYLVFTTQYALLLNFYGVELIETNNLILIPLVFLSLVIIPTLALSQLGIREGMALLIIGTISNNSLGIISASFTLWLINIALPAIFGSAVILQHRFKKLKK